MSTDYCAICQNTHFEEVIFFPNGYMSDGTPTNHPLIKEECSRCGTVRTRTSFNWSHFYSEDYCPSRNTDTVVVNIDNMEQTRSRFVFEWISSLLGEQIKYFSNMLEIGCGQGFVLEQFPIIDKHGIEPSKEASTKAATKANIRNIGYDQIGDDEKYDLLFSYCVIEHLENPNLFLQKTKNILAEKGIMIIALPIQDKFNYDLLFMDHLYHFTHENFAKMLNTHGFEIVNYELGKESYSNIGIYVCRHSDKKKHREVIFEKNKNITHINHIMNNLNQISQNRLYAFGYGEIAKTIIPYTTLDERIIYYIDDFNQGKKVISSATAKGIFSNEKNMHNVILLVNPKHREKVLSLFAEISNVNFINIFEGITIE